MIPNNPNSLTEARDRMLDRLGQKLDKVVGHRGDMHIADFKRVDENSGHLLIGFDKAIGPVTTNDVTAFVASTFNGHVAPILETAKQYTAEGAVSLMINRHVVTRQVEDKDKMLAVSSTMFLDQEMGDTWEVSSHSDGTQYLSRRARDDISAIVTERRRRMQIQASVVTFGNALSAGVPNLNSGDEVRFFVDGKILDGKVTSVGAEIKIKAAGTSYSVAREAVTEILQVSPDTKRNVEQYLADYFGDAYGDKSFAQQLSKTQL